MALKRNERYPGRYDNPTADHPQGAFKNRTAPNAQDGSYFEQDWGNDWSGFFERLLTLAGITPNGSVDTAQSSQYYDALQKVLFLNSGAPAIGIPFFWPLSAMPNTVMTEWADMVFLKFNDATFSATTYPKLALVYPALKLPEMRGEFIRVWDDGRGVDSGRTLLSAQGDAIRNITGQMSDVHAGASPGGTGAMTWTKDGSRDSAATSGIWAYGHFNLDASKQVPTAAENRPRNVAWNFLVRAK